MSEIIRPCPFCGDKRGRHHKHLSINPELGVYHCLLCDARGTVTQLRFLYPSVLEGIQVAEAVAYARKMSAAEHRVSELFVDVEQLAEGSWESRSVRTKEATQYLIERGLNMGQIIRLRPFTCRNWMRRVIFPIRERNGAAPVFFVGRAISDRIHPKYQVPPKETEGLSPKKDVLFGLDEQARLLQVDYVVVCEGIFDAVAVGGVALLGKEASNEQLRKILSLLPPRVFIALDRDAEEAAMQIYSKLRFVVDTKIIHPPTGCKDWGETLIWTADTRYQALKESMGE